MAGSRLTSAYSWRLHGCFAGLVHDARRTLRDIPLRGVGDGLIQDPRPRPCYFGPDDRPLFGVLHAPPGEWKGARVLLCPPLGYEALFAYITLRELAASIARAAAAAVMTCDYDGTGDSAGSDTDDDRLPLTLASIHYALDHLKSLSGTSGPLILIGLRAGALLAACAASTRRDVTAIALWGPCATGRLFLREQRVFSQLSATHPAAPPGLERDWGARGFEANGAVFTDEMVTTLEQLSLRTIEPAPASRILLLQRADMPDGLRPPATWRGAQLEEATAGGFSEMMDPPWLWHRPDEAIDKLTEWVGRVADSADRAPLELLAKGREVAILPRSIEECPIWFGPNEDLFGVLTRPSGRATTRVALLVTSTFGYRTGSNRLNVVLARRLADQGVASLRIDIRGVGESRQARGPAPAQPYDLSAVEDAVHALGYLRDRGYTDISLIGICAGAFLCWQAALRVNDPIHAVLINLESFEYLLTDREHHLRWAAGTENSNRRPSPGAGFLVNARWWWRKARRATEIATELARASVPSSLRPAGLPAQLAKLGRRGARVTMVFSDTKSGFKVYQRQTAWHRVLLEWKRVVTLRFIEGPDHSFTPRWAVDVLANAICDELAAGG